MAQNASRIVGARRAAFGCAACLVLGGCSLEGAPSYDLFGAHFPAWLLCAVIGIVVSLLFRGTMIVSGLDDVMPLRLVTYAASGAAAALWLWLSLFGER